MPKWTFENKITLGNIIQMALIAVGFVYAYATLSGTVTQSAEAVKTIPAIESRVTTIETRINMGQAQREQFQERTEAVLEEMRKQNILILQAIARLEAKGQ